MIGGLKTLSQAGIDRTNSLRTSSKSRMCGRCNDSTANATRDFWPPLRVPMGCSPVMPVIWKLPRCWRYSCSVFPGNLCARNWTGFIVAISVSTWCCAKYPLQVGGRVNRGSVEWARKVAYTRSLPLRLTCPDSGANSPVKSLILTLAQCDLYGTANKNATHRVDLPAPLDPTIARRESRPTSKLARFKIIFAGSYPNVTSESWSKGGEIFSVSGKLYNDGCA